MKRLLVNSPLTLNTMPLINDYLCSEGQKRGYFFFGVLGFLAQKKYQGDIEYSKISDITLIKYRPKRQVILGLIIGIYLLILGVVFMATRGGEVVGLIILILALLVIILLSALKQTYYQIEGPDLSEKDMQQW